MARRVKSLASDPLARREAVKASIAALPASHASAERRVTIAMPPEVYARLLRAATQRRMSVTAYVRRSAYAMMAHDLGIRVADIFEVDPTVGRDSGGPVPDADGSRFGSWVIVSLDGEEVQDGESPAG
jgi:hypothetical protein